nr:hypothetical protein [Tanacetum cinerariifolium]
MISEEMKQTEHYRMYAEVFRIDVPLTQSQPTESTQETHRTPSAPRSPNPKVDPAESSAPTRSTVIRFCIPQRRSTRLLPPAPVPTVDKADELILQDTLQVILAEHKSRQEQEARENVELVEEHLASVEIEKMVKGHENVVDDGSIPRNAEHNIPGTRLEPRSDKESPEVEFTDVVIPVNVYDQEEKEDEITNEVYELKRREKGKNVEESRITPFPTPIRSPRIHTDLVSLATKKLQELTAKFMPRKSVVTLDDHLDEAMADSLPTMVDNHIKKQVQQTPVVRPRDQDDPHDDAHPEGENSVKRQKTSEYEAYVSGESSSGHDNDDPHDDAHPEGENSAKRQKTSEYEAYVSGESSGITDIDEAKLKKIADEMLRQGCTSRDEHQYHIDQMKNFLKSNIVWGSQKEILVSPYLRNTTPLVLSCLRDPEALALSLINQDLLYLKRGNSGPKKIVLSLHKFLAFVFNDDDRE